MKELSEDNRQKYLKIISEEIYKLNPDYISLIIPILETIHSNVEEIKTCKKQILYGWLDRLKLTEASIDDEIREFYFPYEYIRISECNKLLLHIILIIQNIDVEFDYVNDKFYKL